MLNKSLLSDYRAAFHRSLIEAGVLSISERGVASNADSSSTASCAVARVVAEELGAPTHGKIGGQSAGAAFEQCVMEFVANTFPRLQHLRPGVWRVVRLGNRNALKTSSFAQYEHLEYLNELASENRRLSTILGNDYMVAPDVVVYRELCDDSEINEPLVVVSDDVAHLADLRASNGGKPILHASISAKWTIRSDRAQNSRTEALNLIRNRKGSMPHIIVATGEPLPSRLASIAIGTGDIDCVYHFALYELIDAVRSIGNDAMTEQLEQLIDGKRLKDISDLPLDLSV